MEADVTPMKAAPERPPGGRPQRRGAEEADVLPPHLIRVWRVFALGWLLMLGPTLYVTSRLGHSPLRLAAGVIGIAIVALLYIRLTIRDPLPKADLLPAGRAAADRRARVRTLAAMAATVLLVAALLPRLGAWWLMMFPIIGAGLVLPARQAAAAIGVMLLVALLASRVIAGRLEVMLVVEAAIGGGAIAIRQLTVTLAQLESARTELARRAVDQERLRIARDLHDLLGRTLSVIVLKSELAARRLPDAPALAAAEVRDIERAGREALRHIRAVVSGYRTPTLSSELAFARELLAAQGIAAEVTVTATRLPPVADALLAWAVREGVTNVMRHSRASRCTIDVRRVNGTARASVTDDGRGGGVDVAIAGHGLTGLRERAQAQGGALRAGPLPGGGYGLTVEVPLDALEGEE